MWVDRAEVECRSRTNLHRQRSNLGAPCSRLLFGVQIIACKKQNNLFAADRRAKTGTFSAKNHTAFDSISQVFVFARKCFCKRCLLHNAHRTHSNSNSNFFRMQMKQSHLRTWSYSKMVPLHFQKVPESLCKPFDSCGLPCNFAYASAQQQHIYNNLLMDGLDRVEWIKCSQCIVAVHWFNCFLLGRIVDGAAERGLDAERCDVFASISIWSRLRSTKCR